MPARRRDGRDKPGHDGVKSQTPNQVDRDPMNDAPSTIIWRGMNRAQLDAAYDNNAAVPDATQRRDGCVARSAEMRKNNPELLDLAYGPRETNRIDVFRCGKANAPLFCFIHGGY